MPSGVIEIVTMRQYVDSARHARYPAPMCNLYSLTKGQSAIRDLFAVKHDRSGNLPLFSGIFPDQMAPIIRRGADGERELVMAGECPALRSSAASQ